MDDPASIRHLMDLTQIQSVIYRYSRALDRCDIDLLKDVYWPDATHNHCLFNENAHAFADYAMPVIMDKFLKTLHSIANIHIDVQGESADAESYCTAYHMISNHPDIVDEVFGK